MATGLKLAEGTVELMTAHLRAKLALSLAAVRADRENDGKVSTEPPRRYFNYRYPEPLETPAVIVVVDSFPVNKTGANFVDAKPKVYVAVVVEDKDKTALTLKAYRYQCALFDALNLQALSSEDGKLKLTVVVTDMGFSPEWSASSKDQDGVKAAFRKEVVLECDVSHRENL